MSSLQNTKIIFSFFFKKELRAKRTRFFFIISCIPIITQIVIKIIELTSQYSNVTGPKIFASAIIPFYFALFIQFIALFFGSSTINDEVDNKTLIYLTTSPVSKKSILFGKFLAGYTVALAVILSGLILSFLISYFDRLNGTIISLFFGIIGSAVLGLLIYSAFFCFLGSFMKKSIIFGIIFILGWERGIQILPGFTQKLSFKYFITCILPIDLPKDGGFLTQNIALVSVVEAIITMLFLTAVFLYISSYIFKRKEYDLSDQV